MFHETDDSFYVGLGESRSRDYICVSSGKLPASLVLPSYLHDSPSETPQEGSAKFYSCMRSVRRAPFLSR